MPKSSTISPKPLGDLLVSNGFVGWALLVAGTLLLGCYPIVGTSTVILDIPSTPVSISYRAVYLLASLVILLVQLPRILERKIPVAVYLLTGFWIVYALRIYYDFNIAGLNRGYATKGIVYYYQYGIGGSFIPALVFGLSEKQLNYERLLKYTRYAFVASCLIILVYIYTTIGLDLTIFYKRIRLGEDDVIGPILLSQTGGALLVLAVIEITLYRKKTFLIFVQVMIGILVMVMGGSRGPLASVAFVILLLSYQNLKWFFNLLSYWFKVALVFFAMVATVVFFIIPNMDSFVLFNRISKTVEEGQGLDARGIQWNAAWQQFLDSPFIGDQITENRYWFYPHNFTLEVLMSTGLLGGFFVFSLLVLWLIRFTNRHRISKDKWWVLYFMMVFFGYASFSQPLINQTHLWLLLTLSASIPLSAIDNRQGVLHKPS